KFLAVTDDHVEAFAAEVAQLIGHLAGFDVGDDFGIGLQFGLDSIEAFAGHLVPAVVLIRAGKDHSDAERLCSAALSRWLIAAQQNKHSHNHHPTHVYLISVLR